MPEDDLAAELLAAAVYLESKPYSKQARAHSETARRASAAIEGSRLGWSYRRPILAGWYWWQRRPTFAPEVVLLVFSAPDQEWQWNDCGGIRFNDKSADFYRGSRWMGPIPSPGAFDAWPDSPDAR